MSSPATTVGSTAERGDGLQRWAWRSATAVLRCAQLVLSGFLGSTVLLVAALFPLVVTESRTQHGVGTLLVIGAAFVLFPVLCYWTSRRTAEWTRRRVDAWFGVRIPVFYQRVPVPQQDERGHWWTGHSYHSRLSTARAELVIRTVLKDPACWRDALWFVGNAGVAGALALPCLLLVGIGSGTFVVVVLHNVGYGGFSSVGGPLEFVGQLVLCAAAVLAGVALAPHAVRIHADWARRALDPTLGGVPSKARLTERVQHLTSTRAEAVGSQAAELRRIERDLHDGAQARLVAIGMTLGTIEHLMDTDPAAARELLAEARQSSAKALQELRDLVRGIHPPVLAERGLGDAVRALALDSALPTEVCVSLPDRPAAPVEAAVYFSVCELLANAAKHSGAEQVWVDILYRAGTLRVTVTDDGHGVADPSRGSGLRGIERRLGTFDGVLAIDSTSGGPTIITLELPCELSSPRTSTSFGKA